MTLKTMGPVRKHMSKHLSALYVRIIYKDPAKVYVSSKRTVYQICYKALSAVVYDGLMAFVMLTDGDEIVLCKLKQSTHYDLQYEAKELPIAFSRCPVRTLQVDKCQIMGYLIPCLEK